MDARGRRRRAPNELQTHGASLRAEVIFNALNAGNSPMLFARVWNDVYNLIENNDVSATLTWIHTIAFVCDALIKILGITCQLQDSFIENVSA